MFDPSTSSPLDPDTQTGPDNQPVPPPDPPYHRHIPYTDPVTGKPTGGNFTDQGQYGQPIVSAHPPVGPDGRPIDMTSGRVSPPSSEPFIPSRADRPHSQWGTDDWILQGARNTPGLYPAPLMPQMRDIAQLIHGAVMGLGRFGSHYTGMPAIAMGTYASAYWKAYQSGMKERAAQNYQQYRMARQMTIDRGKEETEEYSKIYAAYLDDKGNVTDTEGFSHALYAAADKYHNETIKNYISSGNLGMAERVIQATDAHVMNLIKAIHQEDSAKQIQKLRDAEIQRLEDARRKEEERRKAIERERQKYDPSATGPGPDYTPVPVPPASIPAAPSGDEGGGTEGGGGASTEDSNAASTEDSDIPADTTVADSSEPEQPQKPTMVADASGQVPIGGVAQGGAASPQSVGPGGKSEPDAIERAAKDYVFSRKLPPGVEKNIPDIASRMTTRAGQLEDWLDDLESNPKINPKDITPALRKVFPSLADKIEGYLAGKISPLGRSGDPEWRRAIAIANRVNPDFSQGTFQSRQQGLAYWTRGDGGKNLTSLGTAMRHAQTLLDHLSTKPWPYTAGIARQLGGKDTARLDSDISTFAEEYVRAMSGKGPTIPEIKEEKERLSLNYPESYLRSLVEERVHLLQTKLKEQQDAFTSGTGWPQQDILKRFKGFTETDPLATNRDRGAVKGLEDLQDWSGGADLSPQDKAAKQWLDDPKNANDPLRKQVEERYNRSRQ